MGIASGCLLGLSAEGWVDGRFALGQATVPAVPASTAPAAASPASNAAIHSIQLMQMLDQLPPYRPQGELSGKAILSGSTTMNDLGRQWATQFKLFHPSVEFSGAADGSEAALKLLASDPTVIAGVSRPVDAADQSMLQAGKCKHPIAITVAMDAIAVYVHKSNPLPNVSPNVLNAIFAMGADGKSKAKTWSDVGVQGSLANQPINIYERGVGSGSQAYISKTLLGGAKVVPPYKSCNSNTEICKFVGEDPKGIGIAELHYDNPNVRRVPLMVQGQMVPADEASVLAGRYPLTRPLMLVLDKSQLEADGRLRESVLRFVLSRDGQTAATKAGFYPLNPSFIRQQLQEIAGQQLR
jgi:phosphate transport system substrate-binding protein